MLRSETCKAHGKGIMDLVSEGVKTPLALEGGETDTATIKK